MQTTKDLYKVLEISREASKDDIRKAHRNLVRQHHPDVSPKDPTAEERFKEVQQAYEVLSNEKKRLEYNKQLHTSSRGSRSGRQGTRGAGRRTKMETTSAVDLSDLLERLTDLSSHRAGRHDAGSWNLQQGENLARIAKQLGVDTSRLSKLLGENIKVSAKVSFRNAEFGEVSATDEATSGEKPSGMSKRHKKRG